MNSVDAFNFFFNVVVEECKKSNCMSCLKKECSVLDSRDTDFNEVENRLTYMYYYGYSLITSVDYCVGNFLKQCLEQEKNSFSNKIKICSLSNGPGIDIVGYLIALHKFGIRFNSFPILKAVNLYQSWQDMFQRVTKGAFSDDIPAKNIQLIQCDIFTHITPEAQEYIKNSDILLMINVFVSTKANIEITNSILMKIIALLKPGAFVFLAGSKKNIKNITVIMNTQKEYVTLKFGPLKITLDKLPIDESILKISNSKPTQPDFTKFIVLQKKVVIESLTTLQGIPEKTKKKKSSRSKNYSILSDSVSLSDVSSTNITVKDSREGSCLSLSSYSNESDRMSDKSKNISSENVCQSVTCAELKHEMKKLVNFPIRSTSNRIEKLNKIANSAEILSTSLETKYIPPYKSLMRDSDEIKKLANSISDVKKKVRDRNICKTELTSSNENLKTPVCTSENSKKIASSHTHEHMIGESSELSRSNILSDKFSGIHVTIKGQSDISKEGSNDKKLFNSENSVDLGFEDSFHSLFQHCETLVTTLEKQVENLASEMNVQIEHSQRKCCTEAACTVHCFCASCSTHQHSRDIYNCRSRSNHICTMYPKLTCSQMRHVECPKYDIEINNSQNPTRPYLLIPVQNENISTVVNLLLNDS